MMASLGEGASTTTSNGATVKQRYDPLCHIEKTGFALNRILRFAIVVTRCSKVNMLHLGQEKSQEEELTRLPPKPPNHLRFIVMSDTHNKHAK